MKILALDLGTHTGWAWCVDGVVVQSGVINNGLRPGESQGIRYLRFRRQLLELFDLTEPDVVAYEAVRFHRGGAAGRVWHGLLATLEALSAEKGLDLYPVPVGTAKKALTGSGRASKGDMVAAAEERWPGWAPEHPLWAEDEADARAVALACMADLEAGE